MPGAPFDATSHERELERLAYARPVDGIDPAAAQAELADIAAARLAPAEIDWHEPSLPLVATPREKRFVAAAIVAAVVGASALAFAPISSLATFDLPQAGAPEWPGAGNRDERADTIRWLASSKGWDVFGFLTTGGNVCIASFEGVVSAGGTCTSRDVFGIIGLRLGMSRTAGDTTEYLSVLWGPTGGPQLSDAPLPLWKQ